jgi:hypothetical protein
MGKFENSIGWGGNKSIKATSQEYNRGTDSPVTGACTGKGWGNGEPNTKGAAPPMPLFGGGGGKIKK